MGSSYGNLVDSSVAAMHLPVINLQLLVKFIHITSVQGWALKSTITFQCYSCSAGAATFLQTFLETLLKIIKNGVETAVKHGRCTGRNK
jgi:ABC-type uncharacterized transport system permease subunit